MIDPDKYQAALADPLNALRLRLLANGYKPLPNWDKVCLLGGWPRVTVDEATILSWKGSRALKRQATGLRVERGLCVADVDSTDPGLCDGFRADLAHVNLEVSTRALERRGGAGGKFALFCRREAETPFYRIQGRKWVKPEDIDKPTEERPEHRLEVFGGAKGGRQFGAFGPHSHDDRDRVLREYHWVGPSPLDVALAALPVLTREQVYALVDAFDARAAAAGYIAVPHTTRGETVPSFVFDLVDTMDFDGNTLDDLPAVLGAAGYRPEFSNRISSEFLGHGTNKTKCIIGWSGRYDCICVHDFESGITHLPASEKPPDSFPELVDPLAPLPDIFAEMVEQSPSASDLAALTLGNQGDLS